MPAPTKGSSRKPAAPRPVAPPPAAKAEKAEKADPADKADKPLLHPRNRHQGRYDFKALIKGSPELADFVILNPHGKPSIDFANPAAVRVFNRALLKQFHGIAHWDIPPGYLCPPIPGRADYLHHLADLLAESNDGQIPRGAAVHALDIGVGANVIYPLIGHSEYGWQFLGSDIDPIALAAAKTIIHSNRGLRDAIQLRLQPYRRQTFQGLLTTDERFDLSLCNPPFHASLAEATRGSSRKWRNLGKQDPGRKLPVLNFGGQAAELWCEGGEAAFVRQLIEDSARVPEQVLWFSTLISKAANLPGVHAALKTVGAQSVRTVDMAQGQKQSRFVAWTFLNPAQRAAWAQQRWGH